MLPCAMRTGITVEVSKASLANDFLTTVISSMKGAAP